MDRMRVEEFPLAWRWTQSSHTVLPPDVLALLTPLLSDRAGVLYRRGENVFPRAASASTIQHVSEQFEVTRAWLATLDFAPEGRVCVVWDLDTGISLPWTTFVTYWDDFCYPASDGAFVFSESGGGALAWNHYEVFEYVESAV
jgi:hypothetical protein